MRKLVPALAIVLFGAPMMTIAGPAQAYVAEFLNTFKEYPSRQKAASFTIDQVMKRLLTPVIE